MKPRTRSLLIHLVAATAALSLAACGGDGDDDSPPPAPSPAPAPQPPAPAAPAPASVTLQGQVTRNSALKDATVCLDLNGNDACDAGEPASSATQANGNYSLTATPAQAAAARLIAIVKANVTEDASKPGQPVTTTTDYVLKRPAGSAGGINPLTTLVQAGVAAGMSEAQARTNAAAQLGIAEAKIDEYQDDPPAADTEVADTARWIAAFTSIALREGVPLEVADPAVAGTASDVMDNLIWLDASNHYWRSLKTAARAAGAPTAVVADERARKITDTAQPDSGSNTSLYRTAYLTPTGWKMCGRNTPPLTTTGGNPSRSLYCDTSVGITINHSTAVSGTMADLVTRWQTMPTLNRINNDGTSIAGLLGALGSTALPAAAQETHRRALTLTPDIVVSDTWTRALPQTNGRTTLAGVVAHYAVGSVNLTDATNVGNTTLNLSIGATLMKNMRVAFGAGNAVQYYQCDLATPGGNFANPPNCVSTVTGTYSIDTINGAPIMRFAGTPAVDAAIGYDVVYTEIDWGGGPDNQRVYRAHATKADYAHRFNQSLRLNDAAWTAMKTQLGL